MPSVAIIAGWIAVLAIASATPVRADTERFAVVIGHNTGAADEQQLRYAESDAQRFADLLGDIGGVPDENQLVLRGKTAEQARHAMISINERIRTSLRSGADSVLFVYYSGHGDADTLHLGDTRLPLRELESLVRGSPAGVRVLVIDSCRSGSITRVKGGAPARPSTLATAAPLLGEGMVVLTASTFGEDAQESDQLGGSFFTHYLLSGLRGAADEDGDRIITVAEAFSYTRDQTIVASSRTLAGTQHPTFHYDLRGRADLVLADLGSAAGHGKLTLPAGATWLVMRTVSSRAVVGEIAADARRRTLSLRPGTYAVRGRARDALLDGTAIVAAGLDTVVDASKLDRTTYAPLVRKGKGKILGGVSGPFAGFSAYTLALDESLDTFPGVVAGWMWVRPSFTLSPRISATRMVHRYSFPDEPSLVDEQSLALVTVDMRVTRAWDLGRFSFDLGLVMGGGRSHTTHNLTNEYHPDVHIDATLGMNLPLWGRTYLGAEVAAQTHIAFGDGLDDVGALLATNLFFGVWL
ncbi:MAG TPA: caspase family protein [Kofleriaceae bacterium]|nr:caspase family protein [Kofleriaceae bacterium]